MTVDQFTSIQHLKIKCPYDGCSMKNEVNETTKKLFKMFPNLEALQLDGTRWNNFFEHVFAVQPPEKQLPI